MDAGYGARVLDSSAHANHGLINGPTIRLPGGGGMGGDANAADGLLGGVAGAGAAAPHAWTISGAVVDDVANGLGSLGFAAYFDGSRGAGAFSRKALRDDGGRSSNAFTVQLLAQFDGANGARGAQTLIEDGAAFHLGLDVDGEIVWRINGVRLDTARYLKSLGSADARTAGLGAGARAPALELTQLTANGCYRTGAHLVPSSRWRQLALVFGARLVSVVLDGSVVYEAQVSCPHEKFLPLSPPFPHFCPPTPPPPFALHPRPFLAVCARTRRHPARAPPHVRAAACTPRVRAPHAPRMPRPRCARVHASGGAAWRLGIPSAPASCRAAEWDCCAGPADVRTFAAADQRRRARASTRYASCYASSRRHAVTPRPPADCATRPARTSVR